LSAELAKYEASATGQLRIRQIEAEHGLQHSAFIQTTKAASHYEQYEFSLSHKITKNMLEDDPRLQGDALLLHLASLSELRMKNELLLIAHRLAEERPANHVGHYAIGTYYYSLGEFEKARSHFRYIHSLEQGGSFSLIRVAKPLLYSQHLFLHGSVSDIPLLFKTNMTKLWLPIARHSV
jgi:tetratricopeptide (TPR) repeat protein